MITVYPMNYKFYCIHAFHLHLTFCCMHGMVSLSVSMIFMLHILSSMPYAVISSTSSLLLSWSLLLFSEKWPFDLFFFYFHFYFFCDVGASMPRFLSISVIRLSCSLVFISVVCLAFSVVMSSFLSLSETKLWLYNNSERKPMLPLCIVSASKSLLFLLFYCYPWPLD